ncbi:MAG: hypothetical protein AAF541_17720 [Pseudomonadota bacterium]
MSDQSQAVPYMARSHAYYEAQGFDKHYQYAHNEDIPFTQLPKPLNQCTLGLVTTASTYARVPLEPRKVDSAPIEPEPTRLYADDLSWDKAATHLDDLYSFLPLAQLREQVERGNLGALAPNFHCAPTEYSQRATKEGDAPDILNRLRADGVDIALLVPL